MAGFFENLKTVSERNDMNPPASEAYNSGLKGNTTQLTSTVTQSDTIPIQPISQNFGEYLNGILVKKILICKKHQ